MKTKLTLGIDISRLATTHWTGVEIYTAELLNRLVPELRKKYELKFYSARRIQNLPFEIKKEEWRIVPGHRAWTFWHLAWALHRDSLNTFFTPSNFLPFFAPSDSIVTVHDVAHKVFPETYSFVRRMILDFSVWRAKSAKKIIVPSMATKSDLFKYYKIKKSKINVIPYGFDPIKMNKLKREKIILFIGRIEAKKNLVRLIRAFEIFSKKQKNWKLILAGPDGFGSREIHELADRSSSDIELPGYIDFDQKKKLLVISKIFAFPSLYEGFGIPILEAQSADLPVLTSRTSSCGEVAEDGALLVNPKSVRDIAQKLFQISQNYTLRSRLVRAGKSNLDRFDWNIHVQKLKYILES